jgi:ubiquinol-cytochrome c reductase iron-sulfur subunit
MLIRIKPNDVNKVVKRQGQEALTTATYSPSPKSALIWVARHRCTSSRPIASCARATVPVRPAALRQAGVWSGGTGIAQLPITIDKDGYLVANGNFIEPVGPAFWERRS